MRTESSSHRSWTTRKERDGIKVEVTAEPGSVFPRYRATMLVDGPMETYLQILDDVDNYTGWLHATVDAKVVELKPDREKVIYCVSRNPWPVQNRDYYALIRSRNIGDDVHIQWHAVEGPTASALVRVEKMETFITLQPKPCGTQVHLTLEAHIEPGGSIPGWVVDWFIGEVPFNTLKNMRKLAGKHHVNRRQSVPTP
jgi:hypothetical protein